MPKVLAIVQANPGFSFIRTSEEDAWVEAQIIAWRIMDDNVVYPITDDEVIADNDTGWAIQRPDGSISVWWTESIYDNFTLLLEAIKLRGRKTLKGA